jgi:hypothetical protein
MTPPNRITYVDRQGRPINRTTWLALSARPEYVVVARDAVRVGKRQIQVMTIWLGLNLPSSRPPIFETLLHSVGSARPRRWSWPSLAQARAGHRHVVSELSAGDATGVTNSSR